MLQLKKISMLRFFDPIKSLFSFLAATAVSSIYKIEANNKPKQVIIQPQNITLVSSEGSLSGSGNTSGTGQQNKLYYVIPKTGSTPNIVGSQNTTSGATTKTMILNGKEAKTVFLSSAGNGGSTGSNASSHPQPTPIVVLNQNGHPNPVQLLPVFSSAKPVTSVAAARPIKVTEEFNYTSEVGFLVY